MKYATLSSTEPSAWLRALPDDTRWPCVFTSSGNGWRTTVAWNPVVTHQNTKPEQGTGSIDFVAQQTALGRKILGYVSYDIGYSLLGIARTADDDLGLPNLYLLAFDNYLEITPEATTVHYTDVQYLRTVKQLLGQLGQPEPQASLKEPFAAVASRTSYSEQFSKVQQYITNGDVYQVNLTHRLESSTTASPRAVFARIAATPTSFMAYIEGPDFAIHSASPERFVRIQDGILETFPIKGTRPRGDTPAEDRRLQQELLASQKDKAELSMITDLLRNDLGKVCQTGTVMLKQSRSLLQNATVTHTFSHISGTLLPAMQPIEALLAMFPGGSITGCPKKRAMEIIDELEPTTRSLYCGSLIMIEPDGQLDASIAIRTLIQKGERLILQVGGGIVHDSDEEAEYQETWHKAQGILRAFKK